MVTTAELLAKQSQPKVDALNGEQITLYLAAVSEWALIGDKIERTYRFTDYHQTIAFVNVIANIIHAEDHHPDLKIDFNHCVVRLNTHSVNQGKGGISENDFICAAKFDAAYSQSASYG